VKDQLPWASEKDLFVGFYFCLLVSLVGRHFPWKSVWWTQAPSRAVVFVWLVALGKTLTLDNLRRRHIIMMDRCCICKRNGSWWITFFYIVMWFLPFGVPFLVVLSCLGLCLEVSLIYLIVGGPLAGLGVLWCGKWCLRASSGVFGRK
jgi:hypothetical protein